MCNNSPRTAKDKGAGESSLQEETYSFKDLCIHYPASMELSGLQEVPDIDFVSFFLVDKEDSQSRIEFGISEYDTEFLATAPKEELTGEMAAMVDEMMEKTFSLTSVSVLKKSEIVISDTQKGPEVYSFAQILKEEKERFMIFSVQLRDKYCISTVCQSGEAARLEYYNNLLEKISVTNL